MIHYGMETALRWEIVLGRLPRVRNPAAFAGAWSGCAAELLRARGGTEVPGGVYHPSPRLLTPIPNVPKAGRGSGRGAVLLGFLIEGLVLRGTAARTGSLVTLQHRCPCGAHTWREQDPFQSPSPCVARQDAQHQHASLSCSVVKLAD